MMYLAGKGFYPLHLTFVNLELGRLCNRDAAMKAWAGKGASVLQRLLNEVRCADTLGLLEYLPHLELAASAKGRIAVWDAENACVLLNPDSNDDDELCRAAEAAVVLAVAVGDEDFNPEGERWPRASALSQTTR
jgi:hypothetical protein